MLYPLFTSEMTISPQMALFLCWRLSLPRGSQRVTLNDVTKPRFLKQIRFWITSDTNFGLVFSPFDSKNYKLNIKQICKKHMLGAKIRLSPALSKVENDKLAAMTDAQRQMISIAESNHSA